MLVRGDVYEAPRCPAVRRCSMVKAIVCQVELRCSAERYWSHHVTGLYAECMPCI